MCCAKVNFSRYAVAYCLHYHLKGTTLQVVVSQLSQTIQWLVFIILSHRCKLIRILRTRYAPCVVVWSDPTSAVISSASSTFAAHVGNGNTPLMVFRPTSLSRGHQRQPGVCKTLSAKPHAVLYNQRKTNKRTLHKKNKKTCIYFHRTMLLVEEIFNTRYILAPWEHYIYSFMPYFRAYLDNC